MFSWKKKTAYRKSKAHKTTWTCTISNFLPLKKLNLRSHWLRDASIIQKLACKCFRGEDKERMGHCLHGLGCCSEIANLWPFNHRTLCLVLGSIGHLGIRKYVFCWSLMHNWNTHTLYCWAGKTYRIHGSLLACWFVCWLKLADVVWFLEWFTRTESQWLELCDDVWRDTLYTEAICFAVLELFGERATGGAAVWKSM